MPPSSYPAAQISASVDRNSAPSLSARAALDAYAAKPHLRSSPTFEFLHFAVVGTYGKVKMDDFDVNLLGLQGDYGDRRMRASISFPLPDPWWRIRH